MRRHADPTHKMGSLATTIAAARPRKLAKMGCANRRTPSPPSTRYTVTSVTTVTRRPQSERFIQSRAGLPWSSRWARFAQPVRRHQRRARHARRKWRRRIERRCQRRYSLRSATLCPILSRQTDKQPAQGRRTSRPRRQNHPGRSSQACVSLLPVSCFPHSARVRA